MFSSRLLLEIFGEAVTKLFNRIVPVSPSEASPTLAPVLTGHPVPENRTAFIEVVLGAVTAPNTDGIIKKLKRIIWNITGELHSWICTIVSLKTHNVNIFALKLN
jgi:hypothetical protein